jgi:hypothetical protein
MQIMTVIGPRVAKPESIPDRNPAETAVAEFSVR